MKRTMLRIANNPTVKLLGTFMLKKPINPKSIIINPVANIGKLAYFKPKNILKNQCVDRGKSKIDKTAPAIAKIEPITRSALIASSRNDLK